MSDEGTYKLDALAEYAIEARAARHRDWRFEKGNWRLTEKRQRNAQNRRRYGSSCWRDLPRSQKPRRGVLFIAVSPWASFSLFFSGAADNNPYLARVVRRAAEKQNVWCLGFVAINRVSLWGFSTA
jgi:hypothetical protein